MRKLGVPTVADRVAQMVAKLYMEPKVEPQFHEDSYGYRPGKSALQAVTRAQERCWKQAWVVDLDIRAFFDTLDHSLIMRAVKKHTDERWILLYIERWLKAPVKTTEGFVEARDQGSPQGSVISPLLSNIFMHHAFDDWMRKACPTTPFERYADDAVVHCTSEKQAKYVRNEIAKRLTLFKLELHPEKTKIVYCKHAARTQQYEHIQFDFLGFSFRPRAAINRHGQKFLNFLPAVSKKALKNIHQEIRGWRLHVRNPATLEDLAQIVNPSVQGWYNYYGRFYKSELKAHLRDINTYLVRWVMRKFKRFRGHPTRAKEWLRGVAQRTPTLFVHWDLGLIP
jgi:RNA-directed DNA polymerase